MVSGVEAALIGASAAIAGGLLSGAYQEFRDWRNRPKLSIGLNRSASPNIVHSAWNEGDKLVERVIARVSVQNHGKKAAVNCRIFVVALHQIVSTKPVETDFYDSLQIPWAGWIFDPKDIPDSVTFYADLVRVRKDVEGWDFTFASIRPLLRDELKKYKGTFRFHVVATADNAKAAHADIDVTYNHDWHGFQAVKQG
jgi:hypothetical protein